MNDSQEVTFPEVFDELVGEGTPSAELVERIFDTIFLGAWSETKVAALLAILRIKGETPEVIGAAAAAMRRVMIPIVHDDDGLLDTCGTGGDGSGTLNLSTGAAIIAAGAGISIAKHGNRAMSSKSGSADVLRELGIPIDLSPAGSAQVLRDARITFMLAPTHHPAMRHVVPVRRELGVRTIFNCLGPLANPAHVSHQLVGAYADRMRPMMAAALKQLGTRRAWVVRSLDGLDEVSPFGPTRVTELSNGTLSEFEVCPGDFGMAPLPPGAAAGNDAAHNAKVLHQVLSGEPHPSRDAFLINAAAAIVVAREVAPKEAMELARAALASGGALAALERWRNAAAAARLAT